MTSGHVATGHATPEELRLFLLGNLPEPELEQLAAHLETCPRCQETLPSQLPDDPLVAELHRPLQSEPHAEEPECGSTLDELEKQMAARLTVVPGAAAATDGPGAEMPTTTAGPPGESLPEGAAADRFFGSLPRQFGRYRLVRCLGRGGMGSVYLAHDGTLERPLALKVSRLDAAEHPEAGTRFLREARAAARLQHEGICRVLDYGVSDGIHFIAMDYIEGQPLAALLKSGAALEQRRAATLVRQVALALDEAHRHGVIHRDLNPGNVMLDAHDRPRVVDFGLSRLEQDPTLTEQGRAVGTPAYMSPEQVQGETVTPSTDV
jgi:predicted Ser/Thr protein kinase